MDDSDEFLVARARRRDKDAFSQLYRRHFHSIYRYARLRLNNVADAEDLASGVFLNSWRTVDRFSPKHDGSFRSWLFRLAHNAVIDFYRRDRGEVSLESTEQSIPEEFSDGPEGILEWQLTVMALRQALDTLTSEQREVVILRFIERFSVQDVGHIMGKQVGAVRALQFRALKRMARALKLALEGDPLV